MTNEEAANVIFEVFPDYADDEQEASYLAVEALEYRTPKKVLINKTEYPDGRKLITYGCPTCRIFIPHKDRKYCSNCGQALDWSDIKEESDGTEQ